MSGKKKSLASKLQRRRALKVSRRDRVVKNSTLSSSAKKARPESLLRKNHSPPVSDDDRPAKRVKQETNRKQSQVAALRRKSNQQKSCDLRTDGDDGDDDSGTDTASEYNYSDDSYKDDAEATSGSDAMSTGKSAARSARNNSESDSEGHYNDTFEGFGAVASAGSPTSVQDSDAIAEVPAEGADSDDDVSGSPQLSNNAGTKQIEEEDAPSTPALRKSTRSRKVTAKVAALADKSTPTEWDSSDAEGKNTVHHEDIMVTSAAPPAKDESVVERDILLKNTYKDLVPLRVVVFTSTAKQIRTVFLSKWMNEAKTSINKQFVTALASFKTHDIFVNLSRVDPAILTSKLIGKAWYVSFALGLASQLAMCVSVVVINECYIGLPARHAGGTVRKEITGYFITQEFERFAGAAGAVYNIDQFSIFAADDAFKFGTFVKPNQDASPSSKFSARTSSMFSSNASPSSVAAPAVRPVLPSDAVIPLYDYRSEKTFDPAIHLNPAMYGKLLPSHRDFPTGSLALIAYTTSHFTLRTGEPGLGGNLMWAALLAAPPKSDLPDPPSPVKKPAASKSLRTPTKASSSKNAGTGKNK
ncbi:hypothetical protein BJ138DRAFT_1118140 [Hygrophoropsis aurantiaca]|uniref:Uncharacterized protein n=1 Tax=Hygrophoropsis aurantiaca TaxID=72124 RepID=A0ACB7ZYG1_9AGAM|nr:hypothetical protein BJ138DRAFT_1118140 [Hygrophoropsis aurantiaca]